MNDVLDVSGVCGLSERRFTNVVMAAVTDAGTSAQYGHRDILMKSHHWFGHLAYDTIEFETQDPDMGLYWLAQKKLSDLRRGQAYPR